MSDEIKVSAVVIKVKDIELHLSVDEARELRGALDRLLGSYPIYHWRFTEPFPQWNPPYYNPIVTCEAKL